ncbi:MAG: DNA recombination protein RmuC [Candidatus Nomurabacteria bacterium]|jgi:DNA recombination protein RmuC|nr:DNA recombination protein RmuC [Candidatus Nomurabacteria bacterium]
MNIWVGLVFGLVGAVVAVVVLKILQKDKKTETTEPENAALQMLKQDLTELTRSITTMQSSVGEDITKLKDTVNTQIKESNRDTQSSLQKQLSESGKIVADVSARLAKLDETNKRVVGVADELKMLQNVLQNPKQRGVFGEFYLESVLGNVLATTQYATQYKFKNGEAVDAVIFLDKGKVLPIDSKFSLENYNRMINESDKTRRDELAKMVAGDLKKRIDETAKYIRPSENTMDFAFMFIPSEALYYDTLINDVGIGSSGRDLIEYAFRDKKVIIVSPTSFMAYLQTVLQGLKSLQIEKDAREIQGKVAKLGEHIARFDEYMVKLGKSLDTTVGHYNNAHKEIEKVDKDVVRIAGGERKIETQTIEKVAD